MLFIWIFKMLIIYQTLTASYMNSYLLKIQWEVQIYWNLKLTTTGIFTPQKLTNATTGFQYPLVILFQDHYLSMIQCSWPEMEGEACRELRTVMQSQQQVVMGTEQILRKTVSHHLLFPLPNIQKRYIISNYTKIFPSLETQAWKIK